MSNATERLLETLSSFALEREEYCSLEVFMSSSSRSGMHPSHPIPTSLGIISNVLFRRSPGFSTKTRPCSFKSRIASLDPSIRLAESDWPFVSATFSVYRQSHSFSTEVILSSLSFTRLFLPRKRAHTAHPRGVHTHDRRSRTLSIHNLFPRFVVPISIVTRIPASEWNGHIIIPLWIARVSF